MTCQSSLRGSPEAAFPFLGIGTTKDRNMDAGSAATTQLVDILQQLTLVTYFDLSAMTLLFYDYFLTLPDEVDLVWGSRWTATKVLLLLNRYIPFLDAVLGVYHQLAAEVSNATCYAMYAGSGWMVVYGVGISEVILIFRTYALWGKDRRVGAGLGTLFVVGWAFMSVYLSKFLKSLEFVPMREIAPNFTGCFVTKVDNILYICYVITLSYETTIVSLTLIKGMQHCILSYTCLLVSSSSNVIVLLCGPPGYTNLLSGTQRMVHVILTTRIVLNIRRSAKATRLVVSNPEAMEFGLTESDSGAGAGFAVKEAVLPNSDNRTPSSQDPGETKEYGKVSPVYGADTSEALARANATSNASKTVDDNPNTPSKSSFEGEGVPLRVNVDDSASEAGDTAKMSAAERKRAKAKAKAKARRSAALKAASTDVLCR
ncbi:hypothetical protein EVG20_g6405 [Dentipellis fragilis]|uniref:DUF6533 domain-containing protein n=1 Tax=Dentipellis fragilis TaxID=205917 RepID=A0A4Y9YM66_9AGAM|nr:hypothetical protein EVG20_g6405 [Dentipellis fragilis]